MARTRGQSKAQGIKAAARLCTGWTKEALRMNRRGSIPPVNEIANCIHNEIAIKNQAFRSSVTDADVNRAAASARKALKRYAPGLSGSRRRKRRRR